MVDNINRPGVAALKEGNIKNVYVFFSMFILSYVLRKS